MKTVKVCPLEWFDVYGKQMGVILCNTDFSSVTSNSTQLEFYYITIWLFYDGISFMGL